MKIFLGVSAGGCGLGTAKNMSQIGALRRCIKRLQLSNQESFSQPQRAEHESADQRFGGGVVGFGERGPAQQ